MNSRVLCCRCNEPTTGGYYQCDACASRFNRVGQKISAGVRAAWARRGTARTEPEKAWRNFATRAVRKAIACGFLPDLRSGEYACVDCGGTATLYEHRDYTRLIDVEPVCQSCNMLRPRAPMPRVVDFARFNFNNDDAQVSEVEALKERENNSG